MSKTKQYYENRAEEMGLDIELTDDIINKIHKEDKMLKLDVYVNTNRFIKKKLGVWVRNGNGTFIVNGFFDSVEEMISKETNKRKSTIRRLKMEIKELEKFKEVS